MKKKPFSDWQSPLCTWAHKLFSRQKLAKCLMSYHVGVPLLSARQSTMTWREDVPPLWQRLNDVSVHSGWVSFSGSLHKHTHTLTHSTQCLQNILHILHLPLHFLDIFFLASCLFSSHLTSRLAHGPIFRVTFALTFHRDDDGTFASAKFIFFFLFCFIFQSRSDDVIRWRRSYAKIACI